MQIGYFLLISLCLLAIYILFLNIKAVSDNKYLILKNVCTVLFAFSMLRYGTLIAYGDHLELSTLIKLRYFYFATSIGLTMSTASVVWYITPMYRERIKYPYYLLCFLPWILFYVYVIVKQPTEIVQGISYGYQLQLIDSFPLYLSVVQGSFIVIMLILCTIGLVRYKNIQLRVQYIVIILAQIALTLDGIGYYRTGMRLFPPFTASEILGFSAVYYGFKIPMMDIKGIANH